MKIQLHFSKNTARIKDKDRVIFIKLFNPFENSILLYQKYIRIKDKEHVKFKKLHNPFENIVVFKQEYNKDYG